MPSTKVNEEELLDRLTSVFRTHGFEGASLSLISKATGLQRASLYHRFPGGKEEMAKGLHAFFSGGTNSCLLDSLSFGSGESAINKYVQEGMGAWVEALAKVARETGIPAKKARLQAQDAIGRIEGSLVMVRVLKDIGPFERMLLELPDVLLRNK